MVSGSYDAGISPEEVIHMVAIASQSLVPTHRTSRSFDVVREEVNARASLFFADQVLPLVRLTATETGELDVPMIGTVSLTPWSRTQLARMLGIRWDRWFSDALVSPAERADEINRRLSRHDGTWKLRTRRYAPGEEGPGDGVLRAFVGPQYEAIDDARLFDRFASVLGSRVAEYRFVRVEHTDRSAHYVALSDREIDIGDGRPDPHRGGFLLWNSEVGAGAVGLLEYVWRLVCTNGLVALTPGRKLFRRIHRRTTDESLERDLSHGLAALPERIERATNALRVARMQYVMEPESTLRSFLAEHPDASPHTEAVIAAFGEEPEPTRFGLAQAITLAAQRLDADRRLVLETLAGQFIAPQGVAS